MTSDSGDCARVVRSVRNTPWIQLGLAASTDHRGMRRCLGVLKRRGRCDALTVATLLIDNDPARLATVRARVWPSAVRRLAVGDRGPGAVSATRAVLVRVAQDTDPDVRLSVAGNRSTPAGVIAALAGDPDEYVREAVAANRSTPAGVFAVLAVDDDDDVRGLVARHRSTPAGLLTVLAGDSDECVRSTVADNPNTSTDALKRLARDDDHHVRRSVASNPNTAADVLKMLSLR